MTRKDIAWVAVLVSMIGCFVTYAFIGLPHQEDTKGEANKREARQIDLEKSDEIPPKVVSWAKDDDSSGYYCIRCGRDVNFKKTVVSALKCEIVKKGVYSHLVKQYAGRCKPHVLRMKWSTTGGAHGDNEWNFRACFADEMNENQEFVAFFKNLESTDPELCGRLIRSFSAVCQKNRNILDYVYDHKGDPRLKILSALIENYGSGNERNKAFPRLFEEMVKVGEASNVLLSGADFYDQLGKAKKDRHQDFKYSTDWRDAVAMLIHKDIIKPGMVEKDLLEILGGPATHHGTDWRRWDFRIVANAGHSLYARIVDGKLVTIKLMYVKKE
jgi:hypothetical protein